jgi:mono/diheme cytochrome c family protein
MKTLIAAGTLALLVAGCERMPSDMSRQPRYNAADSSPFFADNQAARPPVEGSVAHSLGDVAMVSSGRAGVDVGLDVGLDVDLASAASPNIERGRERYAVFCQPCHGDRGDGDGEVVRRGFPAPPAFSSAAVRAASDDRLRNSIVHGVGVMYPFGDRVSVADATAIVGYVRVLQARGSASPTLPASEATR